MHQTLDAVTPPWDASLTQGEHSLIYYFLVIAGLAMFAMFVRTWVSRNEVSSRYRPAIFAGLGVVGVAFLSYVVLVVKFDVGYDLRGGTWIPNANAMLSWAPRYFDWSVTVPLLMVELVAVSALAGSAARRVRTIGIAAAWAMIFTGFLGAVVIDDGTSLGALWIWGIVSSLCMVVLVVLVVALLLASLRGLHGSPRATYTFAAVMLVVIWFAYPIAYLFHGYTSGGAWTTTEQVMLSVADIIAKVGFGALIHKVAKLRTAQDVVDGLEVHPETVWANSVKQSDAVNPPAVGVPSIERERAGSTVA